MKKLIELIVLLFVPLILCSCEEADLKKGELIEISGSELVSNFHGENSQDFVFAIINEHKEGYQKFLNDLEKLTKETNKTIYYIYYQYIDTESAFLLFNMYDGYFNSNAYHVVEDNNLILTELYTTYEKLKEDLKDKNYTPNLKFQTDDEVKENLKIAQEEYDKGNISIAFDYMNRVWDEPDAKMFFKNNKYLGLIKSWEHFIITDDERARITYRSLLFYENSNFYFEVLSKQYYDIFEKPDDFVDYEKVYYYVKDDIIYTSNKLDGTYKKRFKIKEISKFKLSLFDYKDKKDYIYDRRV